jgi:hypothetical protein
LLKAQAPPLPFAFCTVVLYEAQQLYFKKDWRGRGKERGRVNGKVRRNREGESEKERR